MTKSPVVKIIPKRVEGSLLPARAIAYRRNGNRLEAGGKFLRPAVVALYALMTGERLLPSVIRRKVKESRIRVSKKIMDVL
jgi:hypothetical protein